MSLFQIIYIENQLCDNTTVKDIINKFPNAEIKFIDKVEDIFGRVKKQYLQKRDNLNLFIGEKKGKLVKEAPAAYGLLGEPHYYFIHAYNCIYECNYCYLQGYFHSPDIVLFLNHEEIGNEIKKITNEHLLQNPNQSVWFHAGEYSDSLALTHLTKELSFYFKLFKEIPSAKLELRTKSINIKELLKESPLKNIITSFSLAPLNRTKTNDLKTPNLTARINAISTLHQNNFPIGIHFDPIIYDEFFLQSYDELISALKLAIPLHKVEYISLGVVRFTKEVYQKVQKNYPTSDLLAQEFIKSFDNKIRYSRPMRLWMLNSIKQLLIDNGMPIEKIYLCMEDDDASLK